MRSGSPSVSSPRILAIDAGFANLGWAIMDLATDKVEMIGVIVTEKADKRKKVRAADDTAARCQEVARTLDALIQNWTPRGAIVELPHGGARSASAMRAMALATAITAVTLELRRLPAEWTTPTDGKLALAGKKDASKEEMVEQAQKRYPEFDWTRVRATKQEHVADAIAAYLAAKDGLLCRTLRGGR